jgi:TRAP-type C4-dicarboxylate transport system permease small subunit
VLTVLRTWADRLIGLSAAVGVAGLLVVVGVILVDVVGRAFGHPLTGARDMAQMTMVLIVFGGMALCDRIGGHISVDVLERWFPAGMNRAVDAGSALLGAAIFLGIAWAVWDSSLLSQMLNLKTNVIGLPKAWFQWALSAFALITALGMVLRFAEILAGRPAPHGEVHPE